MQMVSGCVFVPIFVVVLFSVCICVTVVWWYSLSCINNSRAFIYNAIHENRKRCYLLFVLNLFIYDMVFIDDIKK